MKKKYIAPEALSFIYNETDMICASTTPDEFRTQDLDGIEAGVAETNNDVWDPYNSNGRGQNTGGGGNRAKGNLFLTYDSEW